MKVLLPPPLFTVSPAPSVTVSLPAPRLMTSLLAAPMMVMVGEVSVAVVSEATFTVAFSPARSVTVCAVVPWPSCAVMIAMFVSVAGAARLKVPPPCRASVFVAVPPLMLSPAVNVAVLAMIVLLAAPPATGILASGQRERLARRHRHGDALRCRCDAEAVDGVERDGVGRRRGVGVGQRRQVTVHCRQRPGDRQAGGARAGYARSGCREQAVCIGQCDGERLAGDVGDLRQAETGDKRRRALIDRC